MSEQTSPLHDQTSIEARQPVRVTLPSMPRIEAGTLTSARTLSVALFVLILLAGGFIRLTHGNWDRAIGENTTSGHLHPDERFLTQISVDTKAPGSIVEYFRYRRVAAEPIQHHAARRQPPDDVRVRDAAAVPEQDGRVERVAAVRRVGRGHAR
jgi:hypothetical protein